ncbi:TRAP transporter small permease [Marinobacter orientalis]|uniref:TRAP transporter small permease protein n=1 Tax=Marinobacter orientalis TaxID=1928859 RepID=A0A7Y0RDU4_9GAMM|nr:TRAP transporter small permease [Marinobacter orientalis]NMT64396.1 TRAP transporter small permease [Marinobacter orientalis]TGX50636.1 TRAP transporter small permease [Marinobacter orientalis]
MSNPTPAPDKREQKPRIPALDAGLVIFLFWVLALVVFVQFFTRYVLNDSIGWTEELARYLLIVVTFAGACIAVRHNTHISVEFFYRYLPARAARGLSSVVDLLRIGLFTVLTVLSVELAGNTRQMMTAIDLPKSVLYGFVAGCFALMTIYSAVVAWRHLISRKADVAPDVPAGLPE